MYLVIFEDGSIKRTDTISPEDYISVDDGYLQIIDIVGDIPMEYYKGEWTEIQQI